MKNKPLVTVYITNYNYGKFIRKAIESVLKQSLQDFELIIIDDGSTDNSREIIEEYALYENVSIIYQKNKGLNITNNVALKASNGKYIVRLDADDFLDLNALQEMSDKLEENVDLGLVFPNYFIVDQDSNIVSEIKRHDFENEVSILDQPAHGACTMIRIDYLKKVGGYDESYTCQDGYELWVKFVNKFKVTNLNRTLFSYRRHNNNLTNNENRILNTRLKIKESYVKNNKLILPKTMGIIPIKANQNLAFEKFGDTTFLDYKINHLLNSENISQVVVTSSNIYVQDYIKHNYQSKVIFIRRPEPLERINISLFETLLFLNEISDLKGGEAYLFCSVNTPFITRENINDAVNTLAIFNANSLISVRPEDTKFYRHTGNGMRAILEQDKFTKLEREALYKYTGGIILSKIKTAINNKKLVHGNVGHIVVSEQASLNIESSFEKKICQLMISRMNDK